MNPAVILEKLLEIDRAVGRQDTVAVRRKIMEAQDCVLSMQKAQMETPRISACRIDLR